MNTGVTQRHKLWLCVMPVFIIFFFCRTTHIMLSLLEPSLHYVRGGGVCSVLCYPTKKYLFIFMDGGVAAACALHSAVAAKFCADL